MSNRVDPHLPSTCLACALLVLTLQTFPSRAGEAAVPPASTGTAASMGLEAKTPPEDPGTRCRVAPGM